MSNDSKVFTLDDLLFSNLPSSARTTVIEASVTIERTVGSMLARFLDIEGQTSKSFGMTTAALSFNHKINLLTDMKIIESSDKAVLVKFSEIRNLFAHNAVITHFFQCFEHNDIKKFLIKKYGVQKSKFDFEENNCELLFDHLYNDVKQICRNLFQKMMSKAGNQGETEGKLLYHENLMSKIKGLCETDDDFSKKMVQLHEAAANEGKLS